MELRVALEQVLEQHPDEPNLRRYMRYYRTDLYPFPEAHTLYSDYLECIDVPHLYQVYGEWTQEVDPSLLYRLVVASVTADYSLARRSDGTLSLSLATKSAEGQELVSVDSLTIEQVRGLVLLYLKEQLLLEASTLKQDRDDAPPRPDMMLQSELKKLRQARLSAHRDYLAHLS